MYEEIHFRSFGRFYPCDLDFWPSDLKLIGFHCYPGWVCGSSLRRVDQGILELLIGNEKGIDRQTHHHVQSNNALSPSKGGIKKLTYHCKHDMWFKVIVKILLFQCWTREITATVVVYQFCTDCVPWAACSIQHKFNLKVEQKVWGLVSIFWW